jgi:hypothetical protein
MNLRVIALLAALVVPDIHAAAAAPDLLVKTLAALAGSGARDCGTLPLFVDRGAAVACAREAAKAGASYVLVVELSGNDTYTWQGAARDAQGRQWVVFYDADSASGATASPGLGQMLCREVKFDAAKDEVIDCTPSTDAP